MAITHFSRSLTEKRLFSRLRNIMSSRRGSICSPHTRLISLTSTMTLTHFQSITTRMSLTLTKLTQVGLSCTSWMPLFTCGVSSRCSCLWEHPTRGLSHKKCASAMASSRTHSCLPRLSTPIWSVTGGQEEHAVVLSCHTIPLATLSRWMVCGQASWSISELLLSSCTSAAYALCLNSKQRRGKRYGVLRQFLKLIQTKFTMMTKMNHLAVIVVMTRMVKV